MPGFHGDLKAEYSGIEMSTGSTGAIWGAVEVERCLLLKFRIYIMPFLWPARTVHKTKRQTTEKLHRFHISPEISSTVQKAG